MARTTSIYSTTRPNTTIALGVEPVIMTVAGQQVSGTADVSLRLLPKPGLTMDFSLPSAPSADMDQIKCSVALSSRNVSMDVLVTSLTLGTSGIRGTLVPCREPVTVSSPTHRRIKSITFHLLNFPWFFSQRGDLAVRTEGGGGQRLGCVVLEADDWRITIHALSNTKSLVNALKQSGGYAITHVGSVDRRHGHTFSRKDAEKVMAALRLFLSFARGGFTSIVLPVGFDRFDQRIWEQWGAHRTAPWGYMASWFDHMNGQILPEVFPGFWDRLHDTTWQKPLKDAVY